MRRTWAVAVQMIREGIRMKIALVFILVLVAIWPLLFTVEGDGVTLKSRIQMFLSWSLWIVGFVLSVLTILLSCWSLSNEIREKHIQMVAVKPIPRWQFVLGKWLGVVVLDVALLAGCGVIVYGFARYLGSRPPANELDEQGVKQEVLAARAGVPIKPPPDLEARVEQRIRQLTQENRLSADRSPDAVRREIIEQLKSEYLSVQPGQIQTYLFRDLLVDRAPDRYIYIRYKAAYGQVPRGEVWHTVWEAGDLDKGTKVAVLERKDPTERIHTILIPSECVDDAGTLRVRVVNLDPNAVLSFGGEEGKLELLYHIGGFGWNLVRGLALIGVRLLFLAALGVLLSSFLSFPVACLAAVVVFVVASGQDFLADAMSWVAPSGSEGDPLGPVGPAIRAMVQAFMWLVPNFARYDAVPTLADGQAVTLMWLLVGILELLIVRGLILGFLACVLFTRRELAEVVA